MSRNTNARIAGATFLIYILVAFPMLVMFSRASKGEGIDARLAQYAAHASSIPIVVILTIACSFCAFVLAITLWHITRDEDNDIAILGLVCRVAEGIPGAVFIPGALSLISLSMPGVRNTEHARALATVLLDWQEWSGIIAAIFFAVGSASFAFLFLRGRIIPAPLAWLGFLGSAVLVVALPLQLAVFLRKDVLDVMWYPLAAYEIPLGFWLLIKGAAIPKKLRTSAG